MVSLALILFMAYINPVTAATDRTPIIASTAIISKSVRPDWKRRVIPAFLIALPMNLFDCSECPFLNDHTVCPNFFGAVGMKVCCPKRLRQALVSCAPAIINRPNHRVMPDEPFLKYVKSDESPALSLVWGGGGNCRALKIKHHEISLFFLNFLLQHRPFVNKKIPRLDGGGLNL